MENWRRMVDEFAGMPEDLRFHFLMKTLRAHNTSIYESSIEIAERAVSIAKRMNLPANVIEVIHQTALIHDIGTLLLPKGLLTSQERSEEEEFQYKRHPVLGYMIVKKLLSTKSIDTQSILQQHNGNPDTFLDEEISIMSSILQKAIRDHRKSLQGDIEHPLNRKVLYS